MRGSRSKKTHSLSLPRSRLLTSLTNEPMKGVGLPTLRGGLQAWTHLGAKVVGFPKVAQIIGRLETLLGADSKAVTVTATRINALADRLRDEEKLSPRGVEYHLAILKRAFNLARQTECSRTCPTFPACACATRELDSSKTPSWRASCPTFPRCCGRPSGSSL